MPGSRTQLPLCWHSSLELVIMTMCINYRDLCQQIHTLRSDDTGSPNAESERRGNLLTHVSDVISQVLITERRLTRVSSCHRPSQCPILYIVYN
jgi:hypothetical protein